MIAELYKWYDYLPHNIRRNFYRRFYPEIYWDLLNFRSSGIGVNYSLSEFEKKKCIFVHIPKCAGISISHALFNNYAGGHMTIMDYKLIYGYQKFNNFFKFTFIRNPWDRIYSAYTFLKKGGFHTDDQNWAESNINKYKTFDQFVCEWVTEENIFKWIHFIPQHKYICDPYGRVQVDFIGRFESLSEDFNKITQELGLNTQLEHQNKTNKKQNNYSQFYTNKSKKIISKIYKKDIEMFNYNF